MTWALGFLKNYLVIQTAAKAAKLIEVIGCGRS